jgi:hypothetical protein
MSRVLIGHCRVISLFTALPPMVLECHAPRLMSHLKKEIKRLPLQGVSGNRMFAYFVTRCFLCISVVDS